MTTTAVLCADRAAEPIADLVDLQVHRVPDLCHQAGVLGRLGIEADRLVVGVCRGEYDLGAFQTRFRALGFEEFGVELIDLWAGNGNATRLAIMVQAAAARAEAYEGSQPAQAKLSFPSKTSRRSLLTFTVPEYRAAPAIDQSLCAADGGCRACVTACPRGALAYERGAIAHDLTACEPCGLCMASCPAGAILNPAASPRQIERQVRTLLAVLPEDSGARGIAFVCSRATLSVTEDRWFPVTVPCTGMVTPGWMLAPLAMGAGAVSVIPCDENGCPLGNDDLVEARVLFCREFLSALDIGGDRVGEQLRAIPEPLPRVDLSEPFGSLGWAEVLKVLADLSEIRSKRVGHPASPMGLVDISPVACTACGMCARICPTEALQLEQSGSAFAITFDPNLCTACEQCTHACPERGRGAIMLDFTTDLGALAAGRTRLVEGASRLCIGCGGVIAPSPMADHLSGLLGAEHEAAVQVMTHYCVDCRRRSPNV